MLICLMSRLLSPPFPVDPLDPAERVPRSGDREGVGAVRLNHGAREVDRPVLTLGRSPGALSC